MTPRASAIQPTCIPEAGDWQAGKDGLCTCSIPAFHLRDDDYWSHHVWCKHCIAEMQRLNPINTTTTYTE